VRRTFLICRRELGALVGTPLAWMLAAVFAALAGTFFHNDLAFYVVFGGADPARGLWRYVFLDFRLVAFLVIPLLTMRLVAEERKIGTLELLWTYPVRDHEVLLGKLAAAMLVYLGMLATTTLGPIALWIFHPYPLGPLAAGYVGMLLLGFAFIACGLAASTVTENQIASAMATYGVLVASWYGSWNETAIAPALAPLLAFLSPFEHFHRFAQGVVDSRSIAYFLAFAAFFLFLGLRGLGARSWRGIP